MSGPCAEQEVLEGDEETLTSRKYPHPNLVCPQHSVARLKITFCVLRAPRSRALVLAEEKPV